MVNAYFCVIMNVIFEFEKEFKNMKRLGIGTIIIGIMISIIGITMKIKRNASISIIGGADGPTSIFVAGKIPDRIGIIGMVLGVLLLVLGLYFVFRKK